MDYRGRPIANQAKHFSIINYDVGTQDLQQCADALIRIRAEYLFSQRRFKDIGFRFTNGDYYSWEAYCRGIRPHLSGAGSRQQFLQVAHPLPATHRCLRQYLDIIYALAGTISLCKELKAATGLDVGTVIIHPGSPGHCSMITDRKISGRDTLYKLVEGYMPAQSIYILANPFEPEISPWYHLPGNKIATASCIFSAYYLKKFE